MKAKAAEVAFSWCARDVISRPDMAVPRSGTSEPMYYVQGRFVGRKVRRFCRRRDAADGGRDGGAGL